MLALVGDVLGEFGQEIQRLEDLVIAGHAAEEVFIGGLGVLLAVVLVGLVEDFAFGGDTQEPGEGEGAAGHVLGEAFDAQMRSILDRDHVGSRFACGTAEGEAAGNAAFVKLLHRLERGADLPLPLRAIVVRRSEANAMALPGGRIFVFRGLIAKAETPDELAGVMAHEIGHVSHRDGTRAALESAGLSLLFGMLLGDFTGGGAVVVATRMVLQSAYSREVEAAADGYGVTLMSRIGGDPRALGAILARIGGATEPAMKILLDHPETAARVAAINAMAGSSGGQPLLDGAEWAAVKRICSGN